MAFSIWNSIFTPILKGAGKVGKAGLDIATGGAISRMDANRAALEKEKLALEQANLQADQMRQQRRINQSEKQRNIDISNKQRENEALSVTEQSRAGAIEKFQAQSAGESALGVSGLAPGSSPYIALESQINETGRKIDSWFKQASDNIDLNELQAGGALDQARFAERSSIANESILRKGIASDQAQYDTASANFVGNTLMDIGGGLFNTLLAS